jgi:hypothetical protein
MRHLARLTAGELSALVDRLSVGRKRGRPWSRSLRRRILIACVALRTNLTFRELAVVFRISKSTAHRMVASITAQLAAAGSPDLPIADTPRDQWIVDGTLPTRDHQRAGKSKSYRWSCNAQALVRGSDLRVIATFAGGPGHRNDVVHYRSSPIEELCRWHGRVLADGGYRGVPELVTPVFKRASNRPQRFVATSSSASSACRARHRTTQRLACPSRSPTSWPSRGRFRQGSRGPTQPPPRFAGHLLAINAMGGRWRRICRRGRARCR